MQVPMQIEAPGVELEPADEVMIHQHAEKLTTFYDRLTGCRVRVTIPNRRPQGQPIQYKVRIDLTVPGGELVVNRPAHEGLTGAIQAAFRAAGRKLQDYVRQLPPGGGAGGRVASDRGRVVRLSPWEGHGFLMTKDGREYYFHRNSVLHGGYDRLEIGTEVRFSEEEGEKGPQASTVKITRRRRAEA